MKKIKKALISISNKEKLKNKEETPKEKDNPKDRLKSQSEIAQDRAEKENSVIIAQMTPFFEN